MKLWIDPVEIEANSKECATALENTKRISCPDEHTIIMYEVNANSGPDEDEPFVELKNYEQYTLTPEKERQICEMLDMANEYGYAEPSKDGYPKVKIRSAAEIEAYVESKMLNKSISRFPTAGFRNGNIPNREDNSFKAQAGSAVKSVETYNKSLEIKKEDQIQNKNKGGEAI